MGIWDATSGRATEAISVRLPSEVVKLIDLGIAKGLWESRSEAGRCLILEGIKSSTTQNLGLNSNPSMVHGLSLLAELAWEKVVQRSVQTAISLLEEPLMDALRAGEDGRSAVKEILTRVQQAIEQLPAFRRKLVYEYINQSPTFRLAIERYGILGEEWRGGG